MSRREVAEAPSHGLFVPGRLCLFGEHSDWAGGYRRSHPAIEKGWAILAGTDQGLHASVRPHPTHLRLTVARTDGLPERSFELPMEDATLRAEAEGGSFASYVAGTAYQMMQRFPVVGIEIDNHRSDLPIRKGLSSSAAACVLTARAFNRLYDLGLDTRAEMELAYLGERTTPSRCGRLDQGCAFGRRPVLMTFDGDRLDVEPLRVPRDLHFVILDLGAEKNTRAILRSLNACYPVAAGERARRVREYLGPINTRIVRAARRAIEEGDAARIGALMAEAQEAFDAHLQPACPEELTAPRLHQALGHEALRPHILGGKGVGSQGDGAAQFIVRDAAAQEQVIAIARDQLGMSALALTIPASAGSHRITTTG